MPKLLTLAALLAIPAMALAAGERIMVYGDSNTFGWITGEKISRLDPDLAWPAQMKKSLGDAEVIVEGLSGRTTEVEMPLGYGTGRIHGVSMNGAAYLPAALSSHLPLDLVVIMLGTNDMHKLADRTAGEIALGLGRLTEIVRGGKWQDRTDYPVPDVLVITPPVLKFEKSIWQQGFPEGEKLSKALPGIAKPIVEALGGHFMEGAKIVPVASSPDEVHLSEAEHRALGEAAAVEVKRILGERAKRLAEEKVLTVP
ncbi:GDSL-type esterase/lipase family protein [Sutterella sp.]|uniref:GDSL-type esterase/lipase family protein n=1 Tax=Sutterella sp. TaxID=1981025 RepID=UPI0026DF143C|nr:GDSL-type esterase/lipase family protein [Sutterella sp.]MDO5531484.1 GDSL-type esterase/lipase family protein [Sutterella sp.]